MCEYIIERRGGFAGLPARGRVQADALDADDRASLDRLLDSATPVASDRGADRYSYVVTRKTAFGETTREVPESMMPQSVARVVREQI
jgi:Emfourin